MNSTEDDDVTIGEEEGFARAESMLDNCSYDAGDVARGVARAFVEWGKANGFAISVNIGESGDASAAPVPDAVESAIGEACNAAADDGGGAPQGAWDGAMRAVADAIRAAVLVEREACLGDIEHEISAHGSGSREGIALHAAATRIMRRARG